MNITSATGTRPGFVRISGRLCLLGAVIGVLVALVGLLISPAVAVDRYSYPHTPGAFVVSESLLIVNHLLLLAGVLGLIRSGAAGGGLGRAGSWTAMVGLVALTLCEAGAIALADSAYPTPQSDTLDAGYGISSIVIGIGFVLAGIATVKTRRWTGWAMYTPLACGLAVFLLVLPGVFLSGDDTFTVGRLTLTAWMLTFAALGLALGRPDTGGNDRESPARSE
ncbi:hypothetical protein SAMN05216276_105631 [Streptosporangium subroseum]|uniref:DUF998 domain-containing protein n=1 Tax=Streptosporangium subroseum TaxID=106412 RepID=A0A239NEL5_9ACTN|nr:hypothetical protein [Streptosporangium subroseum]SNT53356.1 hypothetical protein SAMN05216276_105631 [Streptosporangium subroseum]